MKIKFIFITNILSQHQVGLWDEFSKYKDVDFIYLSTRNKKENIEERYACLPRSYEINSFDFNDETLKELINSADILFVGSIEDKRIWNLIYKKENIIWAYEHFSKERKFEIKNLRFIRKKYKFKKKVKCFVNKISPNNYLFCLSSHTKKDWILGGFPKDRIYRFGYFPFLEYVDKYQIIKKDHYKILWCGRNIDWKHPEVAYYCYKIFHKFDSRYHLEFYGDEMDKSNLRMLVKTNDNISFNPAITQEETKAKMLQSNIYIFSSDYGEGWGSVLGEAMSSGCIVFASKKAGSTNFLVNKNNGFSFKNKLSLYKSIKRYLKLSNNEKQQIQLSAVDTMKNLYSGKVAAERLHNFCLSYINKTPFESYQNGPLSKY